MLKKARSIFREKEKKLVFSNFVSLSVLNGISFVFPLITVPYLTRVLGPSMFGLVAFANVVVQYFIIFTSFGFAFSATQQISINQDNKRRVSEIFSAVISIKLLISLLCAVFLFLLIIFFEQFRSNYLLFIYTFGIVIGDALVPVWLFQGMQKMKFITIVNLISKFTFTLLIFVFVRSESDYLIVPLFTSYGYLIAGVISFVIAYRTFKLDVLLPKICEVKMQLKESWPIFVSTFSINLYRNANVLLLGLFTNYTIVGYYSSAEKVIKGMQSIISPVSDALFPFMSKKFVNVSNTNNANYLIRLGKYYMIALSLISLIFLVFARPVVTVFLGDKFIDSIPDMQIMSFVILFGGMNYFLGILGLVNMGHKKKFMIFVAITGLISIINLFFLIYFFYDRGASASMLLSEFVLFVMLSVYILRIKKTVNSGYTGSKPKLAIVVLNWNGYDDTMECLQSLSKCNYENFKIILVDNASDDASVENIEKWLTGNPITNVQIIRNSENYGFAKGNNVGIVAAIKDKADYIMLLNNDTVITKNTLSELLNFFSDNPGYSVATPQLRYYDKKDIIWNCGGKLTHFGSRKYFYDDVNASKLPRKDFLDISFITGCAIIMKAELLKKTGMLSEDFFFGEEDFEFSLRLKKDKIKMACVLKSVIFHKVNSSISKTSAFVIGKIYIHYLNRFIDLKNYWSSWKWHLWRFFYCFYIYYLLRYRYKISANIIRRFLKSLFKNSVTLNGVDKSIFDKYINFNFSQD